MNGKIVVFSGHAVQRMFSRKITKEEVKIAIEQGNKIEDYADDTPFPSCLIMDFINNRPLHVVCSTDESTQTIYIITVYIPDPERWDNNFSRRI